MTSRGPLNSQRGLTVTVTSAWLPFQSRICHSPPSGSAFASYPIPNVPTKSRQRDYSATKNRAIERLQVELFAQRFSGFLPKRQNLEAAGVICG